MLLLKFKIIHIGLLTLRLNELNILHWECEYIHIIIADRKKMVSVVILYTIYKYFFFIWKHHRNALKGNSGNIIYCFKGNIGEHYLSFKEQYVLEKFIF